jgi:hypothetical protein
MSDKQEVKDRPAHVVAIDAALDEIGTQMPTMHDMFKGDLVEVRAMNIGEQHQSEVVGCVAEYFRIFRLVLERGGVEDMLGAFESARANFKRGIAAFAAVLIALLVLGVAAPAQAVCTKTGSVTSSSTQIVLSNDLAPTIPGGRHYMFIQNTGTVNPMNVAIGSNNNATSADVYLAPGASWVMIRDQGNTLPGGDVAAISASGTSYGFCDW